MATCLCCNGWVADDLTADHVRLVHPESDLQPDDTKE